MATAAGIAVLLITIASTANAGGSWLEPSGVRVEAGDAITLSAEVSPDQLGAVDDGPYFAYLSGETYGTTVQAGVGGVETDVLLGRVEIDAARKPLRASIDFKLPGEVPPGEYLVTVCNSPCRTGLGDLMGATLFVGVDPPEEGPARDKSTSVATASPISSGVQTPDAAQSSGRATTSLALARHPERTTGLDATWVAISAVFGLVGLLFASLVRTKGG